ncbi:MAG: hypothetical protein ACFFCX_17770, partial [Candidatus Sifarchaeia archaeon]
MALININNSGSVEDNIPGINSVSFNYIGKKATAIQPIDRLVGVFRSDQIIADDGFVRWLDFSWGGDQNEFNLGFFVRSSDKPLTNEKWAGPFYNNSFDIGMQKGKYLQFMVSMITDGVDIPEVRNINVRYITSNVATQFYTKAFHLGFKPETILLTYNADVSDDTIIRFSVAGEDSVDPLDYQRIEPNKIETLSDISVFADKVKILMELAGEFTSDIAVHEFAFIVGGNDVERINKFELQSSSQSQSTDSSESSSSSIDSSSSNSSSSST